MPVKTVIDLFIQICRALKYAHDNRVVHRDLRVSFSLLLSSSLYFQPDNIFMCHNFKTIKVGDFGISKQLEHTAQELSTINADGYPAYVAIELYNDQKYTTSADIWSLGCILYEMAHRRRLFAPDFIACHDFVNWENTKKKVREYQHRKIRETCSPEIKQLILKCVSYKPQDRPTAFAALNDATEVMFNLDSEEQISM